MDLEWNGDGEALAGGEAGLTMGVMHLEPHDIFHFSWVLLFHLLFDIFSA